MSNYPPGVTGAEFAISGPDYEQVEQKTCGATNVMIGMVPGDELQSAISAGRAVDISSIVAFSGDCPWVDGDVDVQGYRHERWWTCPACGTEHTYELDDGPDPDEERDKQRDYDLIGD